MRWLKNKKFLKDFQISIKNVEIIILALAFLTVVLSEVIIASYESTAMPLKSLIVLLNIIPFVMIISLIMFLFISLKLKFYWKFFSILVIFAVYVSLIGNFTFLFPKFFVSYQFLCDLNTKEEPSITLELNNVGKRISINHIFINISNKDYQIFTDDRSINGNMNMIYTLIPN